MTRKLRNDCFLHDSDRLTHAEAVAILRKRMDTVVDVEQVPVDQASGHILAEDVIAPRNIPAHDNAAVDGYAFAHRDYDEEKGSTFRVSARAAAGHAISDEIEIGSAARIFTGAAMPDGLDSIVMQEDTDTQIKGDEIWVTIPGGLKQGANRRLAAEDMKQGGGDAGHGMPAAPAGYRQRRRRRSCNIELLPQTQSWRILIRR